MEYFHITNPISETIPASIERVFFTDLWVPQKIHVHYAEFKLMSNQQARLILNGFHINKHDSDLVLNIIYIKVEFELFSYQLSPSNPLYIIIYIQR